MKLDEGLLIFFVTAYVLGATSLFCLAAFMLLRLPA